MDRRKLMLGDVDLVGGLLQVAAAGIQAGGVVGGQLISADATRYVANQQAKSNALSVLSNEQIQLAAIQAQNQQQQLSTQAQAQNVQTITQSAGPGLLALAAVGLVLLLGR
jgi:hypothetical protein